MIALQMAIGALNDLVDAPADAGRVPPKPIPAQEVSVATARTVALVAAAVGSGVGGGRRRSPRRSRPGRSRDRRWLRPRGQGDAMVMAAVRRGYPDAADLRLVRGDGYPPGLFRRAHPDGGARRRRTRRGECACRPGRRSCGRDRLRGDGPRTRPIVVAERRAHGRGDGGRRGARGARQLGRCDVDPGGRRDSAGRPRARARARLDSARRGSVHGRPRRSVRRSPRPGGSRR